MILVGAVVALTGAYILFRNKVLRLPARNGASWATLLKRMKYRGGRKQRSASRRVLRAYRSAHPVRGGGGTS